MKKNRQKFLLYWLRLQSKQIKQWLRISMLLGLVSAIIIVAQAWSLAGLLQVLIIDNIPRDTLNKNFITLMLLFSLRAVVNYAREEVGFIAGSLLRRQIRSQVLDQIEHLGPTWIQSKPTGSWSSMLLEQIEDIHDFYAHYLPQMSLAILIPLMILVIIFPINWAAGLILFLTAPLIPLFMTLVGMSAADANRRNFLALERLAGYFLDRLRGLETLRLFFCTEIEKEKLFYVTESFRQHTMEVLRLAFLSSSVLEFFSSISIAVAAIYFGFNYLGEIHFGSYGTNITLFSGFLVLILAPEFFQPLRDLGKFYHAKAQAIGAAESLVSFLEKKNEFYSVGNEMLAPGPVSLLAINLWVLSLDGSELSGPLNFFLPAGQRVAVIGASGAGKSLLISTILGFLPYRGSLLVNDRELRTLEPSLWRKRLSWISQNPVLPAVTIRDNILIGEPTVDNAKLMQAVRDAYIEEFLGSLPKGLDSIIGEDARFLSVGQAQRVALARALICTSDLFLLDEPTASLDIHSARLVMRAIESSVQCQTMLLVTHQLHILENFDMIWVMHNGTIIQKGSYADLILTKGPIS